MTADDHSQYEALVNKMVGSIVLGYEMESDDPNLGYKQPSAEEIHWLASWLLSEGWKK